MERNNRIDVVRCVANYTVILLHAGAAFQYCNPHSMEYKFWTSLCWDLCVAALPALFFISGYLLFTRYQLSTYPNKIWRRVKRLLVPYLIWNCTFVAFYLTMGHFVPRLNTRVATFGLDSFTGAFEKILSLTVAPIDGPLWFLRTIFFLSLCSPLLWLFLRNKIGRYLGFVIIVIAYYVCWYFDLHPGMRVTYPMFAITTFYIGGVLAVTKDAYGSFMWFKSKWWFCSCLIGLSICIYVTLLNEKNLSTNTALIGDIGRLLLTPVIFTIFYHLNVDKISSSRTYLFLKEMSFFAYAGHFLFCSMILHTVAPFLNFMTTGKFTLLIFIFCGIGVPVMAGIYWIGRRYFPNFMKLYDGSL